MAIFTIDYEWIDNDSDDNSITEYSEVEFEITRYWEETWIYNIDILSFSNEKFEGFQEQEFIKCILEHINNYI